MNDNVKYLLQCKQEALSQMKQFDHDSKWQAFLALLFAVYLAFVIDTATSHFGARILVLGTLGVLGNGGILLHRKWNEAVEIDHLLDVMGLPSNPSVEVSALSKFGVGVTATIALLPVLILLYYSWTRFPQFLPF